MRVLHGMLVAAALACSAATARGVVNLADLPCSSADALADSFGINTHVTYTDTSYHNLTVVGNILADIGIRHVRDGCWAGSHGINAMNVTVLCIPDGRTSTRKLDWTQMEVLLTQALNITRLEAIEGPNELDLSGDPYWAPMLRAYMTVLPNVSVAILKRSLPIIAPSMGWGPQHATPICADASCGAHCDRANMHSYPGGGPPTSGLAGNIETNAWVVAGRNKPIWATETGYHTATRQYPVVEQLGVDEATQGKYFPRMVASYFAAGVQRTYSYELLDEAMDANKSAPEKNYGIVRADYSYKPAAVALRSMLTLLGEAGAPPSFAPAPLRGVTLTPLNDTLAALNVSVFGKSTGAYYVLLWLETTSYDTQTQAPIAVPPVSVRVDFSAGSAGWGGAALYALSLSGSTPVQSWPALSGGASIPLSVADEVCVLELLPPPA